MFKQGTHVALGTMVLSASSIALSAPAYGQLDEIIVTAQKKSENLQDVPVAITAFDMEALETNRIEGLEDIATFTPGVYVTQNPADPNGVRVNIRGIGTFDPQVGQDSRVAIYQDGVYLGKTQGLAFDMPDLARVEILKGPQGTLYGRNTVAGAVNLISAKPDTSDSYGRVKAEYGNFDHKKVSAVLNGALNENTALRVSGSFMERDGWVENKGLGADFGGEKKVGLRAALGYEPTEALRLDVSVDYNNVQKEPLFYQSFGDGAQPFAAAIGASEGRQDEVTTPYSNESGELESFGGSLIATWSPRDNHELKITAAARQVDSSRFVNLVPTADPNILNAITSGFNRVMTALPNSFAITGNSLRDDYLSAFTGENADERGLFLSPPGGTTSLDGHNQLSLEATYNGEFADGKLEYTGGAFIYNEETGTGPAQPNTRNANDYLFVLGAFNRRVTPLSTHNFLASFVPGYSVTAGPNPGLACVLAPTPTGLCAGPLDAAAFYLPGFIGGPLDGPARTELFRVNGFNEFFLSTARQSAGSTLNIDTTAFAIYGQATYHASEDFRITVGLRYSDESKSGVQQAVSPFFNDNIDLTGNIIPENIADNDDSVLDPSLTLEWDASDEIMVYGSYKESFRSGGFNQGAVAPRLMGETFGRDFTFGREDIAAYELGFKGDFGNRFRLNAAGFYYDFSDKQVTLSLNPLIATERAIVNTDDELYGFEVDAQYALSDYFTARGSYSYIDGETGDTVNPNDPDDVRSFNELQGTPKNSWLLAVDYDGPNGVFGNLTYSHKDDILAIPENDLRLPAIDLVSGRIGYDFEFGGKETTIALWGTNLLDEKYLIDSLPFETFAYRTKVYGQPRSYGISAAYKF